MAGAPFGSIGGWKRAYIFYSLVFLSVQKATLGTAGPAVKSRKPRCRPFHGNNFRSTCFSHDVGHWGPLPAGPGRPSGPWCFAVTGAPFGSIGGWKRAYIFYSLVFLSVQKATLGTAGPAVKSRKPRCRPFHGNSPRSTCFSHDVGHWGPLPAGPGRPSRALVFCCGGRAVWEHWWLEERYSLVKFSCRFRRRR